MKAVCKDGYCVCTGQGYNYDTCLRKLSRYDNEKLKPQISGTCVSKNCINKFRCVIRILYFPIPHNTLCLPPKFCINHCFYMLLGVLHFPKSILDNKLCNIWGADRVYYGELENSQWLLFD